MQNDICNEEWWEGALSWRWMVTEAETGMKRSSNQGRK